MNRKYHVIIVLPLIVFLIGVSVLIYPYINRAVTDIEMSERVNAFVSQTDSAYEKPDIAYTDNDILSDNTYTDLRDDMQAYNSLIFEQRQSDLQSETDYEIPSFILSDYGLESEVFAVLSIPAMDLEMPIYLGATDEHLRDGVAHLSQTSLPIGGENTNCVIAGHRGYNGAPYFRNIDTLQMGDAVTVTNLWETLTYVVVDIQIIDPDDIEAIHIQEGRELLTLLTCHPYASGGRQRYLVVCECV